MVRLTAESLLDHRLRRYGQWIAAQRPASLYFEVIAEKVVPLAEWIAALVGVLAVDGGLKDRLQRCQRLEPCLCACYCEIVKPYR